MKEYLFFFRGGLDFRTASPEQLQKATQKWQVWLDKLAKEGRLSSSGNRLYGHRLRDQGRKEAGL